MRGSARKPVRRKRLRKKLARTGDFSKLGAVFADSIREALRRPGFCSIMFGAATQWSNIDRATGLRTRIIPLEETRWPPYPYRKKGKRRKGRRVLPKPRPYQGWNLVDEYEALEDVGDETFLSGSPLDNEGERA